MLILRLQPFNLDPGDVHESTIWQVAEDTPDFTNIVAETQEDPENLLIKIFNIQAIPGKKYYARARIVSQNAGLSVWSNVDMDISVDSNTEITKNLEPKRIKPPTFDLKYDLDQFPFYGFTIDLIPKELNSATGHYATSWFIKNLDGELIFAREKDEVNLYSLFPNIVLSEGEVYTFETQYHYKNNDNSMLAGITLTTSKSKYTSFRKKEILQDGTIVGTYNNSNSYLRVELITDPSATSSRIEVFKDGVMVDSVDDTIYELNDFEFDSNGLILVRARSFFVIEEDEWVWHVFTQNRYLGNFPYDLPLSLG